MNDVWADGVAYERYIGRWSRPIAAAFIEWLAVPAGSAWLDFGCGSGALSEAILSTASPRRVIGCDQSGGFIGYAARRISDPRAEFVVATTTNLPSIDTGFDACVSGLVLNFLPDAADAVASLAARARPGATIAGYVWDYAEGMELLRVFWDAAIAVDPSAQPLDEGVRFPLCRPEPLRAAFERARLRDIDVRAIDVPTVFESFDDYWQPFLGGQGPAPGFVRNLPDDRREQLRRKLRDRLPSDPDGRISLTARAWAIRGLSPQP